MATVGRLLTSAALIVSGIGLAGFVEVVPLWVVAFGVGASRGRAGYTGSAGVLLEALGPERIVTALVASRPRQDSNLRTRLRRPALYPLSYGGERTRV
jgi:hypothetical protein